MHKASTRFVTVHKPEGHLPPKQRCSQERPDCSLHHFYQVPAIALRGSWNFNDVAHIPGRN